MIVDCQYLNSTLYLRFQYEHDDRREYTTIERQHVVMNNNCCFYQLPAGFTLERIGADRLALAILLTIYSFVGRSLKLPFEVSDAFREAVRSSIGITIYLRDDVPQILREVGPDIRPGLDAMHPGLALSMGVDSVAALAIMPEDTIGVFLDRAFPPAGDRLYKKDHVHTALARLKMLKEESRTVYIVKSDMEYLRTPEGFVIDIGVGIPVILLAGQLGINSVAYGYSLHNYDHYSSGLVCTGDYCRFEHSQWNPVFTAAGLFLNLVTSGLSEMGTQLIAFRSPYAHLASACMRGAGGQPCLTCAKCYRKIMVADYIKYGQPDDSRTRYRRLAKTKWHRMNNVFGEFKSEVMMAFTFMLANYNGRDPFLVQVKRRLDTENPQRWKQRFKYLEQWFNGADYRVEPACLSVLKERLREYRIPLTD